MSFYKVFDVAGSALNAQQIRMNVTASNLANAGSVNGNENEVYRARQPEFQTFRDSMNSSLAGVRVTGISESDGPLATRYEPNHPSANADGNVYVSNVNAVEEMVNMISASRSYQNNVEIVNTTKDLLLQTLSMGR